MDLNSYEPFVDVITDFSLSFLIKSELVSINNSTSELSELISLPIAIGYPTFTDVFAEPDEPEPEHDKEKDFVPEESNDTVSLPDVLLDPDHAPDAEHEVELDEDHVIVTDSPTEIALSDADKVTPIDGLELPPPPPPPPHATISDRDKNKNNVFLKYI